MQSATPTPALSASSLRCFAAGCLLGFAAQAQDEQDAFASNLPELDEPRLAALKEEGILAEAFNIDEKGASVWAVAMIDADPEVIFKTIVECDKGPDLHKPMKSCRYIENTPEYDIVEHEIKYIWFVPRQRYTFRADYNEQGNIRFRVLEGDLKKLDGGWDFYEQDDGSTIARYYATIQPGFPVPRWMVRRSMLKDIPEMMEVIKHHSENPAFLNGESDG